MRNKIGVGYASVTEREKKYVLEALDAQRLSQGKFVAAFEKKFSSMHGHRYGIMCSSGTSALHLALEALRETDGWTDETEVLVPAITFIATSNAVMHAGMKPVFVDVDPNTYNMDPDEIERHITSSTKCIMPVHCFGMPCDMERISAIAKKHGLRIVEDCAEAHFAKANGAVVGSCSDIMACSTYVAHTITTGVGGIMCTSDRDLMEILRSLLAHGRACTCERCVASDGNAVCPKRMQTEIDRRFMFVRLGYSCRAGELEGALGLGQLDRVDEIMGARRKNAQALIDGLSPFEDIIQLPRCPENVEHTYMMFPILPRKDSGIRRDEFVQYLEAHNIETRPMLSLLNQPVYVELFGDIEKDYPVAEYIDRNGFYIGCHHGLTNDDLRYVIGTIASYLSGRGAESRPSAADPG